ncbi:hypothetical protein AVEN_168640-1 [Araneus ventricosus]|uniref:Uncharacterized protein n=1 Tax=Araneus ventricosus TaxID=182803 RepID=A0A4Y2JDR4_ARAVE|nr:hypothetical protein AVEN_168640-1 [Araneus ventricosus]
MEWFHEEYRRKRMIRKVSSDILALQPSNPTSVNTCLCFTDEECRKRQQRCIMTFVQPPFIKTMDTVSQADDTHELSKHSPFNQSEELISLSSGIVADDRVNCDSAEELGENAAKGIVGKRFAEVTLKRKVQVFTLAAMENTKLIDTDAVVFNPN